MNSAQSANKFNQELASFCDHLAMKDFVVGRLRCDFSAFGSWSIEITKGIEADTYAEWILNGNWDFEINAPNYVEFIWDGKESVLTIRTSPSEPLTGPHQWAEELEKSFKSNKDEIFGFIEEYLDNWKPDAS